MVEAIGRVTRSMILTSVSAKEMSGGMTDGRNGGSDRSLLAPVGSTQSQRAQDRLRIAVHDLCQPLTALQCRLELAEMDGGAADLLQAVRDSLAQCDRLTAAVGNIRIAMQQM